MAQRHRRAEFIPHGADLVGDAAPLQGFDRQQVFQFGALDQQLAALALQLHFLQPAQASQPHVEDRLDLQVGQQELGHHDRLRLILVADDLNHPVEVEEGDDIALQNLQPMADFGQPVARPAQQNIAAMIEKSAQNLGQRAHLRGASVDQDIHVQGHSGFQIRMPEQGLHQYGGIDSARLWLQHQTHILGALVADIAQNRDLARVDKLGDALDQFGFLHLIGDLGDDDLPHAPAQILDLPRGAKAEPAATGAVSLQNVLARLDHHPAGGEVRAGDHLDQGFGACVGVANQVQ